MRKPPGITTRTRRRIGRRRRRLRRLLQPAPGRRRVRDHHGAPRAPLPPPRPQEGLTGARRAADRDPAVAGRRLRRAGGLDRPTTTSRRSPAAPTSWSGSPARSASRRPGCSTCGGSTSCAGSSSDGGAISIGALTTYTEIRRSAPCREHLPALVEAAATIGAAQIQNRGTLGGNIANASPAGDTLPVLLALDAEFVVGGARGERTIAASEFWVAYRRTALAPDELILRIAFPSPGGREARFRKVGTRRAQAISKVVLALAWRDGGGSSGWSDVRVALGSVADRPIRAGAAEAALEGRSPTPEAADAAAEALAAEITPDRRRPLDRRLPPDRRRPGAPPARPRRRRLVARRVTEPRRPRSSTAADPLNGVRPGGRRSYLAP